MDKEEVEMIEILSKYNIIPEGNGEFNIEDYFGNKKEFDVNKIVDYMLDLKDQDYGKPHWTLFMIVLLDNPLFDENNWRYVNDKVRARNVSTWRDSMIDYMKKDLSIDDDVHRSKVIKELREALDIFPVSKLETIFGYVQSDMIPECWLQDNNLYGDIHPTSLMILMERGILSPEKMAQQPKLQCLDDHLFITFTQKKPKNHYGKPVEEVKKVESELDFFIPEGDERVSIGNADRAHSFIKNGFIGINTVQILIEMGIWDVDFSKEALGGYEEIAKLYNELSSIKMKNYIWSVLLSDDDHIKMIADSLLTPEQYNKIMYKGRKTKEEIGQEIVFGKENRFLQYSEDSLRDLYQTGYLQIQDLINCIGEDDKGGFSRKSLLEIYNPKCIAELLKNHTIDYSFIQKIDNSILKFEKAEERTQYLSKLKEEYRTIMLADDRLAEYDSTMINLAGSEGITPAELRNLGINQEIIDDYLSYSKNSYNWEEENSKREENILLAFNRGIINYDELNSVFEDIYIWDFINQGTITAPVPIDVLKDGVEDGIIGMDVVLNKFNDSAISAEDLNYVYESFYVYCEVEKEMDQIPRLAEFITTDTSMDKIKELYVKKFISMNDLRNLKNRGIINQEQYLEYNSGNRMEVFDRIFNSDTPIISQPKEVEKIGPRKSPTKSSGNKEEQHNYHLVEYFKSIGISPDFTIKIVGESEKAPFNGYIVDGFFDQGIVNVYHPTENKRAVFVVRAEQFDNYVTKDDNNNFVIKKSRKEIIHELVEASKGYDRVSGVHYHSATLGANILASMISISDPGTMPILPEDQKKMVEFMVYKYYEKDVVGSVKNGVEPSNELKLKIAQSQNRAAQIYSKAVRAGENRAKESRNQDLGD